MITYFKSINETDKPFYVDVDVGEIFPSVYSG